MLGTEEPKKLSKTVAEALRHSLAAFDSLLPPPVLDGERAAFPINSGLESSNKPVTTQDRQYVVTIHSLTWWFVYFPDIMKTKNILNELAIPQYII